MFNNWVIDAKISDEHGLCFCPVDDKDNVIVGFMTNSIPDGGSFVGVFHEDGDLSVEKWCENNRDIISNLTKG